MLAWGEWLVIVFAIVGILITISKIGEYREPITPGDAVRVVILWMILIFCMVIS